MHTDLLIRVILRGPDGFELDDENDAEELADLGTDTDEAGESESTDEAPLTTSQTPSRARRGRTHDQHHGGKRRRSRRQWKARLAEWSPAIKTALAAKGPNAGAIAKLLAQATSLSKPGGDLVQAIAHLTECHTLANLSVNWDKALAAIEPNYL